MLILLLSLSLAASAPFWLPRVVIAVRMRVFARINREEGIPVPGDLVDVSQFMAVYGHPAANGRSRGAVLSDLFWYWLSPGAELHQEHLEAGVRYEDVARATRRMLAQPRQDAEELAARCASRVLDEVRGRRLVRLRDLMMPVWAEFYYELVFGERCPPRARELIVGNADDVVTALKCCGLRHMGKRDQLTQYLVTRLEHDDVPHPLPASFSVRERALYLQGTFFNTAVVQTSEAMAHLLMVVAQHRQVQTRAASGVEGYLDNVLDETLRLYPLFGIAHRITTADICVDDATTIPEGSVLCFDYPAFHRTGYEHPEDFEPDRWEQLSPRKAHHIPFGVAANRPCPAWRLAPIVLRVVVREVLRRYTLHTTAAHTRSLPNRGPCLLLPRTSEHDRLPTWSPQRATLAVVWLRDRWEDVTRSVVQLVLGSYMVWDARRQRLCSRYFDTHGEQPVTKAQT